MRLGRPKFWSQGTLAALVLWMATGCSNSTPPPTSAAPLSGNKEEILRSYTLLGASGPVGAHLNFSEKQQCSLTQVVNGIVVGAGHCGRGDDQWVAYNDYNGEQHTSPLKRTLYVGNPSFDDIFVGELYPEDAHRWPAATSDAFASLRRYSPSEIESKEPKPEKVYIVAGDPITNFPELVREYGPYGFVYHPAAHCEAVRNTPRLASTGPDGAPVDEAVLVARGKRLDANLHVFVQCKNRENGPGQSGGMILNQAFQLIAPFDWQLRKDKFGPDEWVKKPNGAWEKVANLPGSDTASVIEFGTSLDPWLKAHPEFIPVFQKGSAALVN
jgi:hypothetical protein